MVRKIALREGFINDYSNQHEDRILRIDSGQGVIATFIRKKNFHFGGVMNIWWIAGLAIYVLIERVIPAGHGIGRGAGVLLVVWGLGVIYPAI